MVSTAGCRGNQMDLSNEDAVLADIHVWHSSSPGWVWRRLSAVGLTAAVGVAVFADALSEAGKAARTLGAVRTSRLPACTPGRDWRSGEFTERPSTTLPSLPRRRST